MVFVRMSFFQAHSALVRRHARKYVAENAEKFSPDDLVRETELLLDRVAANGGPLPTEPLADFFVRSLLKFAAGRTKRRRKLIEQIAAGDDLQAVAEELRAIDADVPNITPERSSAQQSARRILDEVKQQLDVERRFLFAFLIEDELAAEEMPSTLSLPISEVSEATHLIDLAAQRCGMEAEFDRNEATTLSVEQRREKKLRQLAREAGASALSENHLEDAELTLIRGGDRSDDLTDAVAHLAECVLCRARLEEGELEHRRLVVMAIEAPRGSQKDLRIAAEGSGAILTERGEGRWTAVVDADLADKFRGALERSEQSVVTRLAAATPVEVPVDELGRRSSYPPSNPTRGTNAAEISAWAQVAKTPARSVAPNPVWVLFSIAVVVGSAGLAYVLASR